ncbi:phosphorylase b kinase regulatory subunit beta-like isoform X2 [Lineus longissimus]|uniref:phosphorylase b kinase regulatory subunit beta-like isoform X2 n=1 Tax=Lineus longissimus TaxID=88925 RepID=UPI00315DB270
MSILSTSERLHHEDRFRPSWMSRQETFHTLMKHGESNEVMDFNLRVQKLNEYYKNVRHQIIAYQSPTTGLFPASTVGAEKKVAYVRDSIYCASAIWALSVAYRRIDYDKGRTHELGQTAVKCMRGILHCWMKQADKVEKFKVTQSPKNALHSKFDMITGDPVLRDEDYQHLQIDCVAMFLLYLVEMIESGLQIIYTTDEVTFIQNLVFYIERTYRTPDFGMWERGSKYNNGSPELHASSIGMSKAALEAINGFNVFGQQGAVWSVIYVDIDAYNRNRTIFETLLPRESASKNTDSSLIPTICWPAFATHDEPLRSKTIDKITRKLKGRYGFKRFLRDGYRTVVEDKNRKLYRPAEIKGGMASLENFDGIECEWPMMFVYMIIESMYSGNEENVQHYQSLLEPLLRRTADGGYVLPKYYYVPKDYIEGERAAPGSQSRMPSPEGSKEGLFMWGQAIYIISQLLVDDLVHVAELDPIHRFLPKGLSDKHNIRYSYFKNTAKDLSVQVLLIAESIRLQQLLATYGIHAQTPHQVEPVQIWSPNTLVKAYEYMGQNRKLGLSGRPKRPIGQLGTAKFYRISNTTVLCYPLLFELSDFYLSQDMPLVIDELKNDLAFLAKTWKLGGRPTFCMLIREDTIKSPQWRDFVDFLAEMKRGEVNGVKIRLGRLQEMVSSACIEHLDFFRGSLDEGSTFTPIQEVVSGLNYEGLTDLPKEGKIEDDATSINTVELERKSNWDLVRDLHNTTRLLLQSHILHILLRREGLNFRVDDCTVRDHLQHLIRKAGVQQNWAVVRFCSALLHKIVDSLAPSLSSVLVRGRQVTLGVFGHEEEVIDKPLSPDEIRNILYMKCYPHDIYQAVLQQEMILNVGMLFSVHPELFDGILKVRIGWIIQAMQLEINYSDDEEPSSLYGLSPGTIRNLLHSILMKLDLDQDYSQAPEYMKSRRTSTVSAASDSRSSDSVFILGYKRSSIWRRQLDGALNRVPKDFYEKVWQILEKTAGGLKVAGYHLPQQPTLSDMTLYELNFMLLVEQMLSKIADPAYRQVVVETFMVVATILERNPELEFSTAVDIDKIIQGAFKAFQTNKSQTSEYEKQDSMHAFYNTPPNIKHGTTSYIAKTVVEELLAGQILSTGENTCSVS